MTRITGKNVLRTPCCGTFVSAASYGSVNLMAHEHWTDGRKVGGLMPGDGGLRVCSCGSYYLLGDCKLVMKITDPKPVAPPGWEKTKNNWWTRLLGQPTLAEIITKYDIRPLDQIKAEQLQVPDSTLVNDSELHRIVNAPNLGKQLLIVARRGLWRYLNDPFRDIYREHKKLHAETFPDYRPNAEQIANMYFLAELLQATYSSPWIEVAELFREAGDFNASIGALKLHTGTKDNFYKSVLLLSIKNQSSPGRFKP